MHFHPAKSGLLLLAAVWMAAVPGMEAQQPAPDAGQSIIFSTPDGGKTSSGSSSMPSPVLPDSQNNDPGITPASAFGSPSEESLPAPPQGQPLQRSPKQDNDWIFMTPAEIMGIKTSKGILNIQEHDAAGRPKNLTPIERYLERQQAKNSGTNDSYFSGNPASFGNFSDDNGHRTNTSSFNPIVGGLNNLRSPILGRSFNVTPGDSLSANPSREMSWPKFRGLPSPSAVPNPAQQAGMGAFSRLLEPEPAAAAPSPIGQVSFQPQALSIPGAVQSPAGPVGFSFTLPDSRIGKPLGLKPPPGITGQSATQPAANPSWAPQPPPWESETPQPFTVPKRKF